MLRSYLRLTLFALGLLVGVQVPGFLNAYAGHVEARWLEVQEGLEGFEATAGRFFGGSLDALVEHYAASNDPVVRSDAASVAGLVERGRLMAGEWRAMQGPWYARMWHVLFRADQDVRAQVWNSYRFQLLLAPPAVAWGLSCALLTAWTGECVFLLLGWMLFGQRRRQRQFR